MHNICGPGEFSPLTKIVSHVGDIVDERCSVMSNALLSGTGWR